MWLLLIEVGFVGFVLSLFGLVWRGLKPDGSTKRELLAWIGAAILFFALWVWALPKFPVPFPR